LDCSQLVVGKTAEFVAFTMKVDPAQLTLKCVQRGRKYVARRCPEFCEPGVDVAQAIPRR
jgi:hypothetical protein